MRAGTMVAGRFEVMHLAGQGGMGSVYQARDRLTGELVALKLLRHRDRSGEKRLAREAQVLSDLAHPAIVRYVAHGATVEETFYLALEWLEGITLAARLRMGPLGQAEALRIAWQIADALDAAHQQGIVHRDIKPSNIVLVSDGARVKVLDFGIAHLRGGDEKLTATGAILGTAGYMAPEQARGQATIDARTDVFALGCVLYECLTGQRAFDGEDMMAVLIKIVLEESPRLRDVKPDCDDLLDDLLTHMLAKDADHRPPNGRAVKEALASMERNTEGPAIVPVPAPLSVGERHWMSAALIRPREPLPMETWEALEAAIARLGAKLDRLVDGSAIVVVSLATLGAHAPDAATDLAVRAAKCALLVRDMLPDASVAVVTGRSDRRGDVGELLGSGVALLDGTEVRVDDATRHLLQARFDVVDTGVLRRERDETGGRTLLQQDVPFVGRARELDLLEGMFDETEAAPMAQAAIVLGAAGIGKSRLRQELIARLAGRSRPPRVWVSRGDAVGAGSPFGMLSSALRREAGIADGEPVESQRRKLEARFETHVAPGERARVLRFVGELCNLAFPDTAGAEARSARANPILMGDHVRRAFEDLIAAECAAQPLVLVLDDLHWGDRPSVDLVDALLRNLHDLPLFVLALGRPEMGVVFPELWAKRRIQTLRLGELRPKHSEELVRSVLGARIDDAALGRIVERAAGNAFFLEELVRSYAEGRGETMPDTVLAMVGARIERLDSTARLILRVGSLFGNTFWTDGVRTLLGESVAPDEVGKGIDVCVQREMLIRRRTSRLAGQEEIGFRHAMVRDAAAAMVPEEAKARGHLQVGEWLERAGECDSALLAHHFDLGGDTARAAGHLVRAAEQALEANDFPSVIHYADCVTARVTDSLLVGRARAVQAEAHLHHGDIDQARARGFEAAEHLPRHEIGYFRALATAIEACGKLGDIVATRRTARALYDLADDTTHPLSFAIAASPTVVQLAIGGDMALADTLFRRLHAIVRAAPRPEPLAQALLARAASARAAYSGDLFGAIVGLREATAAFEALGDRRSLCSDRKTLGWFLGECGALEDAEVALRDALVTAERLGLKNVAAHAKLDLGSPLQRMRKFAEARRILEEAAAAFHVQGDRRRESNAHAMLSAVASAEGHFAEAEREAVLAVDLATSATLRFTALSYLACAHVGTGRSEHAVRVADEALALLADVGSFEEGLTICQLARAEALFALGRTESARQQIAVARDDLEKRAAQIRDPTLRQAFLTRIPENARVLDLARG